MTFEDIISNLKQNNNFAFARYGDGELGMMFNDSKIMGIITRRHGDAEGLQEAGKRMLKEMKAIQFMRDRNYHVAIQGMGYKMFQNQVDQMMSGLKMHNADIIHHASQDGRLPELIEALKDRNVIVVGPAYLTKLPFDFQHIPTPDNYVWRMTDYFIVKVSELAKPDTVVLWSASVASNMGIFGTYNINITHIDTGSVFDPYCGHLTRSYHKKLKNPTL